MFQDFNQFVDHFPSTGRNHEIDVVDHEEPMSEIVALFQCDGEIGLKVARDGKLSFGSIDHLTESLLVEGLVELVDVVDGYA